MNWASFYWRYLAVTKAWIINHMQSKVRYEITSPFPHLNGAFGVWEWMNNFIPNFVKGVIMCPCVIKENMVLIKMTPGLFWMCSDAINKIVYSNIVTGILMLNTYNTIENKNVSVMNM